MLKVCATLSLWCLECFHAAGCGCGGEMVEGVVNSKSMQRMQSLLQESLVCQRSRAPQLVWPLITCSQISAWMVWSLADIFTTIIWPASGQRLPFFLTLTENRVHILAERLAKLPISQAGIQKSVHNWLSLQYELSLISMYHLQWWILYWCWFNNGLIGRSRGMGCWILETTYVWFNVQWMNDSPCVPGLMLPSFTCCVVYLPPSQECDWSSLHATAHWCLQHSPW